MGSTKPEPPLVSVDIIDSIRCPSLLDTPLIFWDLILLPAATISLLVNLLPPSGYLLPIDFIFPFGCNTW